jgi:hypothetical protein
VACPAHPEPEDRNRSPTYAVLEGQKGLAAASWEISGGPRAHWSTPRVVTVEKVKRDVKKDHGKHKGWCKKHKKFEDD